LKKSLPTLGSLMLFVSFSWKDKQSVHAFYLYVYLQNKPFSVRFGGESSDKALIDWRTLETHSSQTRCRTFKSRCLRIGTTHIDPRLVVGLCVLFSTKRALIRPNPFRIEPLGGVTVRMMLIGEWGSLNKLLSGFCDDTVVELSVLVKRLLQSAAYCLFNAPSFACFGKGSSDWEGIKCMRRIE
jgi:hypothetical protein